MIHDPCQSALHILGAVDYICWWSHLYLLMGGSEAESSTLLPLLQEFVTTPGLSHSLSPTDALVSLGL